MAYAVVINLDYEHNRQDECTRVWELIKNGMIEAGFRRDGRTFTINLPEDKAQAVARGTIEDLNKSFAEGEIFRYMSDFYGYNLTCTTNLMTPSVEGIEVRLEESAREYPAT